MLTKEPRPAHEWIRPPIRHHSCITQLSCLLNPRESDGHTPPASAKLSALARRTRCSGKVGVSEAGGVGHGPGVERRRGARCSRGCSCWPRRGPARPPGPGRRGSPTAVGRGLRRAPLLRLQFRTPADATEGGPGPHSGKGRRSLGLEACAPVVGAKSEWCARAGRPWPGIAHVVF